MMKPETAAHPFPHEIKHSLQTTCCIVGGGPAGAVLALLLARQGVPVLLLEAHMDFDREFRGDTIHPSIMQIMEELGLAERVLQMRHTKMRDISVQTKDGVMKLADFSRVPTHYPYITIVPQVDFLNFIIEEAKNYPDFQIVMGAQVDELIEENGTIRGVRYRGQDGWSEVRAILTVGTDGRFSRLRKLAGFEPIKTSPPMDILWFRLSRKETDPEETFGRFANGTILVLINRFDYWQAGLVIPKGGYQKVRAAGLEHVRDIVAKAVPSLADRVDELTEWKQISVLSVESNRLPRWYRPGLLLLGDAAHVMSPVGGVGINYAIQDAVVASNVLGGKLKYGVVQLHDLAKVQRQREWPTRLIQLLQSSVQKRVLGPALQNGKSPTVPPWLRFIARLPGIRFLPVRVVALGVWPVRVKNA